VKAYKLKQQPDDFQVDELTDVRPGAEGAFALYRLEKRGWSTPDALAALRRRWKVHPERIAYGGLKDRHALTSQHLTIRNGPRRNLTHEGVRVTYLGQIPAPFTSADIAANRFRITLRAMSPEACASAAAALDEVRHHGCPNYFDDQRFGSVVSGGEFIGRLMVRGDFEGALRLALAAPYEFDRAEQKREKAILTAHWGDWAACREKLPRGHARSLADYLVHHPGDYRGAVARLRPELRGLYLSAYQSHLWNRMLAWTLRRLCRPEQLTPVALRLGEVPFFQNLDDEQQARLHALTLPLPSARLHLEPDDPSAEVVQAVMAEEGLQLRDLRVKGIRELFFSKGERAAVLVPSAVSSETADDERNAGRKKLVLRFELPRGCYATLIVKRVTS
jgi:tRNA pseudouridine13 synthase